MYKLVIIDDEDKIVNGIGGLFPWEQIGYKVVGMFTSAKKALEYIEKNQVDVVLTDIEMPDMSGISLSKELMRFPGIHTVLFSSYSNYEYFRSAIQNGVVDYLLKPVQYGALLECFEKVSMKLAAEQQIQASEPKGYYEQIISKVLNYLRENYRNASLAQAATVVNLSPAYLSRLFKERNGTSFSEIVLQIRMEKAKEMLGDSKYKSYEIAYNVGYNNPKNFSRAFKEFYSISPSEYRKAKLGEAGQ